MVHIFVLVRQIQHPVSGKWVRDPADAQAVALALQTVKAEQVCLFSLGLLEQSVVADYWAQGAQQLEVLELPDTQGGDASIAAVAAWIDQRDAGCSTVLLIGQSAAAQAVTPVLPYALAKQLKWLCLPDIGALRSEHAGWQLQQVLPKGARRQWELTRSAVLGVHSSAAVGKRYAARSAGLGVLRKHTLAALPGAPTMTPTMPMAVHTQTVPTLVRVQPLQARQKKSGHERMLGAIGAPGGGNQSKALVLEAGSVQDKAQAVYDYLDTHSLWSFS